MDNKVKAFNNDVSTWKQNLRSEEKKKKNNRLTVQRVTVGQMKFHLSDDDDREMNPSICLLIVNMVRISVEISYDFWHDQL